MKRTIEDNTVSVLQKAILYFDIPVTNGTIKESLIANPHYPTFKSICDVLSEWKVDHYPLKYQPEELKDIETPFISHLTLGGGHLAFVTKIINNKVQYFDSIKSKKLISFDEFIKICSGAIILLNPDKKSGENGYRKKRQNEILNKSVLPTVIGTFILFSIMTILTTLINDRPHFDKTQLLLILTKIVGLWLSVLLVLHEFEINTILSDKLCHLNKATNCNTVLNDSASKVFGWFGWADIGVIYFMSSFLILLHGIKAPYFSVFAIFAAMSIPYPVFSIYYQAFVLKKWCPLCLGVQLVLILEFILLLPQFSNLHYTFIGIFNVILTLLIIGIIYILFIMYIRENTSNELNHYKYLRFKKNPEVLRTILLNQKHYDIPVTGASLVFGEKNVSMKLTIFLSLHCSHCARAFEKIKKILEGESKTAINIIIITSDIKILNTLYHLNRLNKDVEALNLLDQWFNSDPYSRNKISESLCIPDVNDVSKEVSNENLSLFKACNVIGTPTFFVNGYLLPRQYDIEDVKYFSEIFIKKVNNSI
jgi:uncharacterized membrane protein